MDKAILILCDEKDYELISNSAKDSKQTLSKFCLEILLAALKRK